MSENPSHPLSMLSPEEIKKTVSLLKNELSATMWFVSITLKEPPKPFVLSYKPGDPFTRETTSIILEKAGNKTYEALVNLTEEKVVSFTYKPDSYPSILLEEFFLVDDIVRNEPKVQEVCAKKGLTDMSLLTIEPWINGSYGLPEEEGKRLLRGIAWLRSNRTDNLYAHPMEFQVLIDLNEKKVLDVIDKPEIITPKEDFPYRADSIKLREKKLKPLEIVQKEGSSFELKDNEILWENWRVRFGFNAREGLLLHQVSFFDTFQNKERILLYRLSLSEMITAYGDPDIIHRRKNVFDEGEYGLGMLANSLVWGDDNVGDVSYRDVYVTNSKGEPFPIPNAISINEEDYGIGWKHTDWRLNQVEVRRSRRLVLSSLYTVGNYEYGVYYYFYLDGSIQVEVKLTGIMNTQAMPPNLTKYPYGQKIGPNLVAGYHQHYFTFRIDAFVDGEKNSVVETVSEGEPMDPIKNPYGNAFNVVSRTLKTESEAQRNISPFNMQQWVIVNPNVLNSVGEPVGLKIVPGEISFPLHSADAPVLKRAGHLTKNLWVTPYEDEERYPTGKYPNQRKIEDGLHFWTKKNRNIENTDIVVWYTAGHHHYPRMEDWPVMPTDYLTFWLKPFGFFKVNPAIDVNPSEKKKCCQKK